jgi:hypothetical protein
MIGGHVTHFFSPFLPYLKGVSKNERSALCLLKCPSFFSPFLLGISGEYHLKKIKIKIGAGLFYSLNP